MMSARRVKMGWVEAAACVVASTSARAESGRITMTSESRKIAIALRRWRAGGAGLMAIMILLIAAGAATPASAGDAEQGFALRGIKGLWWEGLPKYRLALPWIAKHRMNF